MFHRRKRAQSNPHLNVNGAGADPSATSAAALAFLSTQKSNANLAAAAAGAALRSRPTTPTNVAEVQTKRTQRRASISSSRSGSVNGRPSSMLERRLSSGSMTERIGTFREQSPNRGAARPAARDAPPVPSIPASYSPVMGHGRSSSVQPTMRVSSPAPTSQGRGSSLQPATRTTMARRVAPPPGPERTDSRGSVNFSYPTSLQRRISDDDDRATERLLTPVRPAIDLNEMVYDSNTRSFRSRGDLMLYEQRLIDASRAQVPPQRKKSVRKEGSHLAQGSVGGRMKVAPDAAETARRRQPEQPQQQEEDRHLARTLRQQAPATDPGVDASPRQDHIPQQMSPRKQRQTGSHTRQRSNTASDNESDASESRTRSSRKTLQHQPSVVREVAEPQETEDRPEKVLGSQAGLRHAGHQDIQETVYAETPTPANRRPQAAIDTAPAPVVIPENNYSTMVPQNLEKIEIPHDEIYDSKAEAEAAKAAARHEEPSRGTSLSPSRKPPGPAFLSPTDPVGNLRHNPPGRSISPMKSALKHSNSRGPSPLGENPEGWTAGHGSADLSDASTTMSESKPMRKKSVRVSFDEGSNVVVAEPEGTGQAKRTWSGGNTNFRNGSNSPRSEESEGMGPRPSLPVFGSVRKEKKQVVEDRPLVVKPHETSGASSIDMGSEHTFGPSSDHKLGAIMAQDFATKTKVNEPNTSKSREPLPPVATSREDSGFQSGYQSDSDESSDRVELAQAVVVEIPEAEREALRTPEGHDRKPRLIEDVGSESGTPTKEKPTGGLFAPENAGGTAPGSYRSPSEGDTPIFTPPEDEDMLMLTKKAAADAIAHGTPPNLIVTVPTPVTEQEEWHPSMPGGLDSWDSPTSTPTMEEQEMTLNQYMAVQDATPAAVGIAEPEVVSHAPGAPVVGEIAAQAEEVLIHDREVAGRPRSTSAASQRTEDESVYSDAAEHLTDTEGDGFMSLDAVVDSPTSPKIEERFVAPAPVSPTRTTHSPTMQAAQKQKGEADEDWVRTQLYWSSLSDEKKKQLEAEARKLAEEEAAGLSSADETTYTRQKRNEPQRQRQPATREALKISPPPKMAPLQLEQETGSPDRQYQIMPGTKAPQNGAAASPAGPSTMRQSLRAPKPQVLESGRMRSSLRGPPPAQVRERPASSSQYTAPKQNYYQAGSGSLNANSRYSTQPVAPAPAPAKPTPREQAIALVQAQQIAMRRLQEEKQAQKPGLRRRGSADSDSSFKRERAGGNGFFAKTSMRGNQQGGQRAASVAGPPQGDRGRRFSVRSLSPIGRKGMGAGVVQAPTASAGLTTLRGNRPAAHRMTPPVQEPPKSSGGFFGRKKGKPAAASGGSGKSRFVDSDSDEDAPRPQRFSSRFADSSDEDEEPATMPPVSMKTRSFRGKATAPHSERPKSAVELGSGVGGRPANSRKPSRVLEEDSSDLEDFEDEETREKTRLNSIQGVEAQAAMKGVHPEAVRLAQAYFGAGLLNTANKDSATGTSTAESTPVRQRNVTPPTPGFTNTSQTSLSPGRNSVPPPNFQIAKKSGSPEQKKKGGVMSFLSRKRKDKNDKVNKRDTEDSGARQGTALERSRLDLEAARRMEEPPTPNGPSGPGGGKLRKKGVPQLERINSGGRPGFGRVASGSFRAEISRSSEIEARPQTSDGLVAHALTTGPIDGVGNEPFPQPSSHGKIGGPIDGVDNDPLPRATHEKTIGPIDGVDSGPILPRAEHETTSGPLDGVQTGKDRVGGDRPGVLRRGTSASAVNMLGGEGKKKEKKRGFLRRMFDL